MINYSQYRHKVYAGAKFRADFMVSEGIIPESKRSDMEGIIRAALVSFAEDLKFTDYVEVDRENAKEIRN